MRSQLDSRNTESVKAWREAMRRAEDGYTDLRDSAQKASWAMIEALRVNARLQAKSLWFRRSRRDNGPAAHSS